MMTVDTAGAESLVNDLVVRTQTTEGASAAAALSSLNQVVVFSGNGVQDDSGVYAKLYDSAGAVLRSDFLVNFTQRGDQHSASVASDSGGNFVVVWAGRGVGDTEGIFFQRYNASGEAQGDETLVNTTVAGKQTQPAIAMNGEGAFAIGWSGQSADDPTGVYLQRFAANGATVGGEVLVNTTTVNHQSGIALAYDTQDHLVAAWSSLGQDTSDWGVYGQRFDTAGDRLNGEFRWNATTANSQLGVALAAGPDGELVAAWQSRAQDGDDWGVVARQLDADGVTLADEILLNDSTAGQQLNVRLAVAEDGQWLATWATAEPDGAGWEVMGRTFEPDGTPEGSSFAVNQATSGVNSSHQQYASVALLGDSAVVVWSGSGAEDRKGVYRQAYEIELIDDGPQQSPNLAPIADTTATVSTELEVTVTATDPNSQDTLTFQLDSDNSPATATLEQTGEGTAIVRWTPSAADEGKDFAFRVLVVDDGEPPLADSQDFTVTVGNTPLQVDLSGDVVDGTDLSAAFTAGGGPVTIVDEAIQIAGATDGMVSTTIVQLTAAPDGVAELLAVDTLDTDISAIYDPATRALVLSGADTVESYERVLRTLTYDNSASSPSGMREVTLRVVDAMEPSNLATISIAIGQVDFVAFAQAIDASEARFFGAAWCEFCTQQKELFDDGGKLLPFEEVTNSDRTLNDLGMQQEITSLPTWLFADDTRLEGAQSLQLLAAAAGISIPVSQTPYLAEIADDTLLVGSPLHVPLDGYDPNGAPLSYTVTTNNPDVTAQLLVNNRSMRIDVSGFGDMVFELFEQRASRATDRVIDLAMEDFYDDVILHRVVNNFVIQGGDPTGTGGGGSDKGDFDDQFHPDLQHNRTGLLSYAKGGDDTNDSQFFITEGESSTLRNLDFNHTIFGILVEGEANRDAISNTAVEPQNSAPDAEVSRPTIDVVMESVEIFTDTENATLLLKAAEGTSGPVEVTVTVTNQAGNSFERTFTVQVANDTFNNRPYLGDVAPVTIEAGTSAQIQLTSTDVEGDAVVYEAGRSGTVDYTFDLTDEGLLTVTPPAGFTGEMEIGVLVRREFPQNGSDFDAQLIAIQVIDS